MRIIHTADMHIGSALTARLPQDKVRQRKSELIATFERMAEEAVYVGARLFIIAGDMFDTGSVPKRTLERIVSIIARTTSVDFLYLSGNHEKNALIESGIELPENLKIFDTGWTYFRYGEVTVVGRTQTEAGMFDSLEIDPSEKNIVVLHGAVGDRSDTDTVGLREAANRGIDYIALGHYHSYAVYEVDELCRAVYSGTPEGRGFDEAGEKGYVIVDTSARIVQHKFVPKAKRRLRIIELDISHLSSRIQIIDGANELLRVIPADDMVRLELTGTRPPELFPDTNDIVAKWADRFYYFEVKDSSRTEIDPEAYRYDKSLKGEFIRLCMSRTDLSDEDREDIIRAGLAALMGEDVEI